jgi:hypothetical protein
MSDLAIILKSRGRNKEVIALMQRCCQLMEQTLGTEHPYTEDSSNILKDWEAEST